MWAAFMLLGRGAKFLLIGGILLFIVLAITGTYYTGHKVGYTQAEAVCKEAQALAQAEASKTEANIAKQQTKIQTDGLSKQKEKERVIYQTHVIYRDGVNSNKSTATWSKGSVYIHDQAVDEKPIDSSSAADATPSEVKDTQALLVVLSNYQQCSIDRERLRAIQQWTVDTQKSVATANNPAKKQGIFSRSQENVK